MKALSLQQPWASLVMALAKRWETRGWKTRLPLPLTIAIHASITKPENKKLARTEPFQSALIKDWCAKIDPMKGKVGAILPEGSILGTATITEIITTGEWIRRHCKRWTEHGEWEREWCFGDYAPGRFAWKLENVRQLKTPLPVKGSLGLWPLEYETATIIAMRLYEPAQA